MPVMASTSSSAAHRKGLTAWHTFLCFAAFFAFMFVVNGIFLWTVITTFPGEDVEKSYLAGLDYNDELARRTRQKDLGWTAEIGLAGEGAGLQVRARLNARDRSALAASGVQLDMHHPTNRNLDRVLELQPAGDGAYVASAVDVPAGYWKTRLRADIDPATDGAEFEATKELRVP
jgi:nitrogen fixation protein FixH